MCFFEIRIFWKIPGNFDWQESINYTKLIAVLGWYDSNCNPRLRGMITVNMTRMPITQYLHQPSPGEKQKLTEVQETPKKTNSCWTSGIP